MTILDLSSQPHPLLLKSFHLLERSSEEALRDPDYLTRLITQAIPSLSPHLRPSPEELAWALIEMSHLPIDSVGSIGSTSNDTALLIYHFLKRFKPNLQHILKSEGEGISYAADLIILTPQLNYQELREQYHAVKDTAKACLFPHISLHSLGTPYKEELALDSLARLWRDVKQSSKDHTKIFEFFFSGAAPTPKGIGLQVFD